MGWFSHWFRRPVRPGRRPRKYRPSLAELENRLVPAPVMPDVFPIGAPPPMPGKPPDIGAAPGPIKPPDVAPSLTVQARNLDDITAGQQFTTFVAGVLDTYPNAATDNLTAMIDWGDKTTPDANVPLIPDPKGHLLVQGTHTYASAGQFTITVTITDSANNATASDTSTATVSASTDVDHVKVVPIFVTAGTSFTGPVAVVGAPAVSAANLSATIDWGDKTTPDAKVPVTADKDGHLLVQGTHTYATPGPYTLTVTITDASSGAQTQDSGPVLVQPSATSLLVHANPVAATAGSSFTETVAVVRAPGANVSNLSATIDWGDKTTADAKVPVTKDADGNLVVQGTHTYASAGGYLVTVAVTDSSTGSEARDSSKAAVQPASIQLSLPVKGVDVLATPGQSFTDVIAVVHDPGAAPGALKVTVDWGDGTNDSNAQAVPFGVEGVLVITGTHTYAAAGQYTVAVSVTDSASGAQGSSSATASVGTPPLPLPPVPLPVKPPIGDPPVTPPIPGTKPPAKHPPAAHAPTTHAKPHHRPTHHVPPKHG